MMWAASAEVKIMFKFLARFRVKRLLPMLLFSLSILVFSVAPSFGFSGQQPLSTTQIFFSAGCSDCWPYTEDVLIPTLRSHNITEAPKIHDYTVPGGRKYLLEVADSVQLPRSIADSLYAFVPTKNGHLVILGHVPANIINDALSSPNLPSRLVIWQPQMHGTPVEYRLWAWVGKVQTFDIKTPFAEALAATQTSTGPLPVGEANLAALLPAVVVTALVDSVNPCAFAVILLLIAFLFTLRQSRERILQLGGVYISMIFLVYLAIGLGLFQAVRLSDSPHFIAEVGTWIMIALGILNLIEYFWPKFPIKLHTPKFAHHKINELIKKATLPATVGVGLLVGLCTFPCSGGIYVSIITLLNAKTTFAWGMAYLVLYNILFVLPLIVILLAVGNRMTAKAWASWERKHALEIRLWYGLIMIGLGIFMWRGLLN